MDKQLSRIGIDDTDFLVTSMIERCPRTMMMRELVMNAIEAAQRADAGEGLVRIFAAEIDGARKLAIHNTGPGMSRDELYAMCDIGASLNKVKGLEHNFGIGAKVASLASNPLGVRYRSCSRGRVHEVVMGKRDAHYGRIWQRPAGGGGLADIRDVTQTVLSEGASVRGDWTEVVLFGATAGQDTVADPYGGLPWMPERWVATELFERFHSLPPGVTIIIEDGLHDGPPGPGRFVPMAELLPGLCSRSEKVVLSPGVIAHYCHVPPERMDGPWLQKVAGRIALLHKGELYDHQAGSPWAYNAPIFGIPVAAQQFQILIELDETVPVMPEDYRQILRYRDGRQTPMTTKDFAAQVLEHRPEWLRDRLSGMTSSRRASGAIRERMAARMARLGFPLPAFTLDEGQQIPGVAAPPEIYVLRDEAELRDRWLTGRAARYVAETNELFINLRYPAVARMARLLRAAVPAECRALAASEAAADALILRLAEEAMVERVSAAVVHGLARTRDINWSPGNVTRALSGEALSLVADDLDDGVPRLLVLFADRAGEAVAEPPGSVAARDGRVRRGGAKAADPAPSRGGRKVRKADNAASMPATAVPALKTASVTAPATQATASQAVSEPLSTGRQATKTGLGTKSGGKARRGRTTQTARS